MAPSSREGLLQASGDRDRPFFLQTTFRPPKKREDPDAKVLAATLALAAQTNERGSLSKPTRSRGASTPSASRATRAADELPVRPDSPTTHLRKLDARVKVFLEVKPCDEYHRLSWLPPDMPAIHKPLEAPAQQAVRTFKTKDNVWAEGLTDYRSGSWCVENQWALRAMNRSKSQPSTSPPSRSLPAAAARAAKQPWHSSHLVTSCMVGGVGGGIKGRNMGLYEDSFLNYKGQYHAPQHGLSSCDVTRIAAEIGMGAAVMRK